LIFNKHGLEILRSNPFLKATMLAVSLLQLFALYTSSLHGNPFFFFSFSRSWKYHFGDTKSEGWAFILSFCIYSDLARGHSCLSIIPIWVLDIAGFYVTYWR